MNRLWRGIEATVSKNLQSGFRPTCLYPYDPQTALKRISGGIDAEDDTNKSRSPQYAWVGFSYVNPKAGQKN